MSKIIVHGGRTYNKRLAELADIYLNVRDCNNCGSPIANGFVCPFCKVDDTANEFNQERKVTII